jgi:hypothetical protein
MLIGAKCICQVLYNAKKQSNFGLARAKEGVELESKKALTMNDLGKLLIVLGILLLAAGTVLILLGRANLPLGRLPGDIVYRGKNTTFFFPLATSLLLSLLFSLVLYLVGRWRR